VLLGSIVSLYSRRVFLLPAVLFLVLDSWVPLRLLPNWNLLILRAPYLKVLLGSVVAMRPVLGRLGVLVPYRSRPDLLRYRLLYRLICLILDSTLRFLSYYRAPCNSLCSRRTSGDYYGRPPFSPLLFCFIFFQIFCTRFYSGLSYGNRSILRYFYLLISG
jgi:hypothetical protein